MAAISATNKGIPDDMLLGNLLFMSVSDMEITEQELEKVFDDNGLDKSYIRPIFPSDAFRRATSSYKNSQYLIKDTTTNCLVEASVVIDETTNTNDKIVRMLSIKTIDTKNDMSNYVPVLRIMFDKATESVSCSCQSLTNQVNNDYFTLDGRYCVSVVIYDVTHGIGALYNNLRTNHNKDTIRNIVKRVVDSMQPVTLMNSGLCKFIPIKHKDTLYGLKGALTDMSKFSVNGNENAVEIIPLIDTDEQRTNVMANMERETKEQLLKLTTDLQELLAKRTKLSTRSANAYIQRFKELRQKSEDYQTLMNSYNNVILKQIDNMLILVDNSVDKDGK